MTDETPRGEKAPGIDATAIKAEQKPMKDNELARFLVEAVVEHGLARVLE